MTTTLIGFPLAVAAIANVAPSYSVPLLLLIGAVAGATMLFIVMKMLGKK